MAVNYATLKPTSAESASVKASRLLAICFLLSGATGLIYEVVWARMLGLVFGATTIAISAVLVAFMGGLALGSALAARLAMRISRPLRGYALMEICIGLYALIVPTLFRAADIACAAIWQGFHPGFYSFAFLRFLLATIALIVPTALMGATLPVIVLAVRQLGDLRASAAAKLYSLNLTGAIGGTIAAGFLLLPYLGVRTTTRVAALTNLLIGITVLVFDSRPRRQLIQVPDEKGFDSFEAAEIVDQATRSGFWFACAFASGLVTIAMQLFWSRVLAMIIGSSTYAFTIVLALFLVGLALGSWIVSAKAGSNLIKLRRSIMFVQLATALSILVSLRITNAIPSWLIQIAFRFGVNSWAGLLALQIVAAATLILLPAILMGMTMPIVLVWAGRTTMSVGERGANSVGLSYAINTIGAIAGALVAAFILIPGAGSRLTAFCVASICIALAGAAYQPGLARRDQALARSLSIGTTALLIILTFAVWPRLNVNALSVGAYDSFVRVLARSRGDVPENDENDRPGDHQLLMFQEGRTATVSVRRDWGITSVAINGRTNASDADDMPTQVMLGQLGVLVAPRVGNGLIVGFATGVTAGSVFQSSI